MPPSTFEKEKQNKTKNKNEICWNRSKSLIIVNPILSAKTIKILRWNDVLLVNFTPFPTML